MKTITTIVLAAALIISAIAGVGMWPPAVDNDNWISAVAEG